MYKATDRKTFCPAGFNICVKCVKMCLYRSFLNVKSVFKTERKYTDILKIEWKNKYQNNFLHIY